MQYRASFPDLAACSAAAAAPFAAITAGTFSLRRKKTRKTTTSAALSSLNLRRSLASAAPCSSSTSSHSTTKLAALSSRDAPAPPPPPAFRLDSLTGRWHKLKAESDDMRAACDAVELNAVLRMGVGLVNTLDIADERKGSEGYFATTLKAGGILDVRERYPWSGAKVEHSRRDKRRGKHSGSVSLVEVDEGGDDEQEQGEKNNGGGEKGMRLHPRISVTWSDPHGGECTDTFVLSPSGRRMTQLSELAVRGKEVVRYKTVFTR